MRKSYKLVLGLLAVLLLLVGIAFLLRTRRWEGFSDPVLVTFYYLPGCGWCEKAKPEWEKFKKEAAAKGIKTREVNAEEAQEEITKKGIRGFPTFMITKNGKESEYSGERTSSALLATATASA